MIKLNLSCAFFRILWLARLIMAADKHSSYNILLGTHHIYRKFILMQHFFSRDIYGHDYRKQVSIVSPAVPLEGNTTAIFFMIAGHGIKKNYSRGFLYRVLSTETCFVQLDQQIQGFKEKLLY